MAPQSPSMPAPEAEYISSCPFCTISQTYPPFSPHSPPSSPTPASSSTSSPLEPETAYTLLSTPHVLAFLDHMPITRGHVLLTTRLHREKLADVALLEAAVLGAWLRVLSRAVMRAVGMLAQGRCDGDAAAEDIGNIDVRDWNIVQNNGVRAAQVVPHVHYHIIPRPGEVPELKNRSWTMFGRGQRGDLDEDEAIRTRDVIRAEITREVAGLGSEEKALLGLDMEDRRRGMKL